MITLFPQIFGNMLLLAFAVATISLTLAKSPVCKPIRSLCLRNTWLTKLVNCPYCLSHWCSLVGVLGYLGVPWTLVEITIYTFATTAMANLVVLGVAYSILVVNALGDD